MKIKDIELKNNLILAPMAGVTTGAFRTICLEMGADLIYAEMVSDKGLQYQNEKTLKMIEIDDKEHPISMQIFGSEAESITNAAKLIVQNTNVDIIDVNMGCPVNKVVKNGSGSALLKTPNKIYDIVKGLKDNIDKPITIKIRAGFDHQHINCDEVARLACSAGVDAIAIHGRTRSDFYNGTANLDFIKMVKDVSTVPVIGNGDIKDVDSAVKMLEYTNVDALMIGRATLGNPWIFRELNAYFEQKPIPEKPSKEEVIAMILEHANRLISLKGEHIAMIEMRTHAAWYLKQIPMTKQYRVAIVGIKTFDDLNRICQAILSRNY